MKFYWIRKNSRTACVSAAVTRSLLKNIDVEIALDMSLPIHAVNPEGLSQLERKKIIRDAKSELKRVGRKPPERYQLPAAKGMK